MKGYMWYIVILFSLLIVGQSISFIEYGDSCNNFDGDNGCRGNQTDNADDWKLRNFQTPSRGDPLWREKYQDYDKLVGYAKYQYNSAKTQANVTIYTQINDKYSNVTLTYLLNGTNTTNNVINLDNSFKGLLEVTVYATRNGQSLATLVLDPLDFIWNHPTVNQSSNYKNGQKGAIIEMFGWPYADI